METRTYYRKVIDLLKKQIEISKTNEDELKATILEIDKAIDAATIKKEDISELLLLKSDLQFIKYR